MELMTPTDSVFLLTESREHPMHVGGLQLFKPPEGAGPDFAREAYDALVAHRDFQPIEPCSDDALLRYASAHRQAAE